MSLEFVKSIFPEPINKAIASSATSLEFVKSIVPEPIIKAIAKPAAIMKQLLVPPADSDEKVAINENYIYTANELVGPEPIADSFSCATVMFADISGFTSWSSNRNPVDVFQLLELLLKDFDIVGLQTGVFKVSAIGDCYLETSGLPDIRDDHKEVIAKISVECQNIFEVVPTELLYTLGSEITDIKLRCGLHYGTVTDGVLRGLQSRFEIFYDTVNTASRMESTGTPTRIQLSWATTDLLIKAGKESWFKPRDG